MWDWRNSMERKKKIALLNMRYDNNYGGNLQRFAMVTILQRMGYEVEYLYIRDNWDDWFANRTKGKIIKQLVKQIIRHIKHPASEPWLAWRREENYYRNTCMIVEPFLEKYVPHTKTIYSHIELENVFRRGKYDAIIAGSDQIWRKEYVDRYGLGTWFLDFVPKNYKGKRVIYGASFGVDTKEFTPNETAIVVPLYSRLDTVSVRENSGLQLLKEYGMNTPKAQIVLDPTLLLEKVDYNAVIDAAETKPMERDMFCYILDRTPEIEEQIRAIAEEKGLTPYIMSINGDEQVSIEQWLRYIRDAKYVFTDSYHGLLFSLIYEKPFRLIYNSGRGSTRFESILSLLKIIIANPNYKQINEELIRYRESSMKFLQYNL